MNVLGASSRPGRGECRNVVLGGGGAGPGDCSRVTVLLNLIEPFLRKGQDGAGGQLVASAALDRSESPDLDQILKGDGNPLSFKHLGHVCSVCELCVIVV